MEIKDGDFASFLERKPNSIAADVKISGRSTLNEPAKLKVHPQKSESGDEPVSFEELLEVLNHGDEEQLHALAARMREDSAEMQELEPMSDEEFERQALDAGGDDGDPETPE